MKKQSFPTHESSPLPCADLAGEKMSDDELSTPRTLKLEDSSWRAKGTLPPEIVLSLQESESSIPGSTFAYSSPPTIGVQNYTSSATPVGRQSTASPGPSESEYQIPGYRLVLPANPAARKAIPIGTGVLDYFSSALAEIAKVSKAGNDQHNPGQPLHWSRGKSVDHWDTIIRHGLERGSIDTDGHRHSAKLAWRALALLQQELEDAGAPVSRGSK